MSNENNETDQSQYLFPACTYLLGLGAKKEDGSIVAFDDVLKEDNCKRGLLIVKISEDKEATNQEALLISPEPFTDGDTEGVQLDNKPVVFEDNKVIIDGVGHEYKNMELGVEKNKVYLLSKDDKTKILELTIKVIEFLQMHLVGQTVRLAVIDGNLSLSLIAIRNVTPINANVIWTENVVLEEGVTLDLGVTEESDPEKRAKWISENSYLNKDNNKYALSECGLSQLEKKIFVAVKKEGQDDIIMGHITPPAPPSQPEKKPLEPIDEEAPVNDTTEETTPDSSE